MGLSFDKFIPNVAVRVDDEKNDKLSARHNIKKPSASSLSSLSQGEVNSMRHSRDGKLSEEFGDFFNSEKAGSVNN